MLQVRLTDSKANQRSRLEPRDSNGPIGVLAIQGSYPLHLRALRALGVVTRQVKRPAHLVGLKGLILPGGESTVLSLLTRKYGLFEPLRELGRGGLPMLGTCAGAILLGKGDAPPPRLGLAPINVLRNAYGSQVDSFTASLHVDPFDRPFRSIFIRAPRLVLPENSTNSDTSETSDAQVLCWHEEDPVLVRVGSLLLATFHPELTDDLRVHRYFLEMARCPIE